MFDKIQENIKIINDTLNYAVKTIDGQKMIIKTMTELYDAVIKALARQKKGHSDGWGYVQIIIDRINDNYDLEIYRENKKERIKDDL